MASRLQPAGLPMLIGSQPLKDYAEAIRLVLKYVPEIPNWVQLPAFAQEGMVAQFASGLPGLVQAADRTYVDTASDQFDDQMVAFFEDYLLAAEPGDRLDQSRFTMNAQTARGFFELLDALAAERPSEMVAVKGQITGPITFCTALTDQDRRAIFYHDALRDAAVKMIALKAAWQVRQLRTLGLPTIVFIDEPALAGYGSSEFISISKEDISGCLQEVIGAVQEQGGLTGVHVCANTDWSLLLSSQVDIINFDAHGYFDKFVLYARQIKSFLDGGGCLAWGMVPTSAPEQVEAAEPEGLWRDWNAKIEQADALGIPAETVHQQAFITPSCGTGALTPALSKRVLALTRALSLKIRSS